MAKKETPLGKVGRVERERRYNQGIRIATIIAVSAVVIVVVVGIVLEGFIRPNQSVATVMGEEILSKDFEARVRYDRGQLVNQYLSILQFIQDLGSDPSLLSQYQPYLQQIQFQLEPNSMGGRVIETMIDDIIIKNEAQARGIEVTTEEIDEFLEANFGYFPEGTPTPEPTFEIMPTSTFSATQLSIVTLTPTFTPRPTFTPTQEAEDDPTPIASATEILPTATTDTFTYEEFEAEYQDYIDFIDSDFGVSEDIFRGIIEAQLYREKLVDLITAEIKPEEEQVWARHILVEDEETALEVLEKYNDGEDWAALALEYSSDESNADRGGDLNWFNAGRMVPEFSEAAFSAAVGEVAGPVETSFGWHLIQILGHEMRPIGTNEFEQLKQTEFINWLAEIRLTVDFTLEDNWVDRIPTDPTIPQHLLLP